MESFLTPYGLSNFGQEKLQFTPFLGGPKSGCSNSVRAGFIESHNFFVLGPTLVKFQAGPALFHGHLRAFGKCTNGVAFSKGRPNLASGRLTL